MQAGGWLRGTPLQALMRAVHLLHAGGVGTLRFAANDLLPAAEAADAYIAQHPVLAQTCAAALTQHAAAGQSLVISYQVPAPCCWLGSYPHRKLSICHAT
jgi:hypothetical protein